MSLSKNIYHSSALTRAPQVDCAASADGAVQLRTSIAAHAAGLAPVQVAVLNITDAQADYCREIVETLKKSLPNQELRVITDLRNEKITYKIREHSMQKLPFILVVGDKEKAAGTVAVRARGGQDLGVMSLDAFVQKIASDLTHKSVV